MTERRVVRSDSAARAGLEASGWVVIARSWGAGLRADDGRIEQLKALVERVTPVAVIRELGPADVDAILGLDRETAHDYPGGIATAHAPLTFDGAVPTSEHPGWAAFVPDGRLVAMTFVDVDDALVETDFTVVHKEWRGRGLGAAVKAASVIALFAAGQTNFRTGGSAENAASIAANRGVGYVPDEEWLTYAAPAKPAL